MNLDEAKSFVERYGAAWNTRNIQAIMALHSDSTEFEQHGVTPRIEGKPAVDAAFRRILMQWRSLRFTVRSVRTASRAIVFEARFEGVRSDGSQAFYDSVDILGMDDSGRIASKDSYFVPISQLPRRGGGLSREAPAVLRRPLMRSRS